MARKKTKHSQKNEYDHSSGPPGRIKIAKALGELLREKDFNSITTAEISRTSGVNEALIYRYFGDKRGLLHAVLSEHLEVFLRRVILDLKGIKGALNKLRKLIWSSIYFYDQDRIFSKILLLEVRNYPGYFESETYGLAKQYTRLIVDFIQEGINTGEIRDDISPKQIRQVIIGGIEHLCLPAIIYNGRIDADALQEDLCTTIFEGIIKR